MTYPELRKATLFLGVEGSTGLWVVSWQLDAESVAPGYREVAAMGVLSDLLEAGLIEVTSESRGQDDLDVLEPMAARRAILDESNYADPKGERTWMVFEATDSGRDAYFGGLGNQRPGLTL